MNTKSLTIMGVIIAVLIAGALLVSQKETSDLSQTGQLVFPDLMNTINDVAELLVEAPSGTMTIARDGEAWIVKEKNGYQADMGKVRETIIGLGELKILEAKTKNPELYDKLGLQEVDADGSLSTRVTLKDSAGAILADVIVGNRRPAKGDPGRDEVYVRKPDDPQTWLAIGHFSVEKLPGEWLDKEFLDIEAKRVKRVRIIHPDKSKLVLKKDKPGDLDYTVVNLPKGEKVQSQFTVNNIVSTVTTLSLDDVKPRSEISFDDKSVVTAIFETFDGLEGTVKLLRKDEKNYVKVSAAFNPDLIWKPETEEDSEAEQQADGEGAQGKDKEKEEDAKPEKPKMKPEAEVKAEIEALNKKVAEWVYVIPKFRADTLLKKPQDLISKSS